MNKTKRFLSIKTKIMISTLIPVFLSFTLISSIILTSLFNVLHEEAKAEFLQISKKYAVTFENKINNAMAYLATVSNVLKLQAGTSAANRETLQKTAFSTFDEYGLIDGSSIYFEPNMFDGKDAEYIGTQYGTASSGRICYYFYEDGGKTAYLPEALENDIEFELPHYTEAKIFNRPVYTEPAIYEVDGRIIPMFTLTYPVQNKDGHFIGAVTVDLFLEDIYKQIENEKIYETGYVVIANDNNQVVYSPRSSDIGKKRNEAGLDYRLPAIGETSVFTNGKSIINGKSTMIAIETIYIPRLDSRFYVSVSAPTAEINADGLRLTAFFVMLSAAVLLAIALILYSLIRRITAPIKEITENANRIADGNTGENIIFSLKTHKGNMDEINILHIAIQKMLTQISGMQLLKLEALEMKHEKEKAETATRTKNDFLAKMSHEIRTPMNAVIGMTELILRKDLPQDIYENAQMIKNAGINLLSIINDILDFSKIESGKLEIIETDYILSSLVHDVVSIIRVRLIDEQIQFIVEIDPDIPLYLTGDEIRIRQILTNLLSNAVKYTNEGHISLKISGEISENTVMFSIKVADSGIGIKEEDIDKLFGDFAQIDTTTNRGIEGTGLGLAITRNLCRLMGGDITVHSKYGSGSVFTAVLPQTFTSYKPFAAVENAGEKSVLLYETRPVYRDSIIRALESLGVKYTNALNIPELFSQMETHTHLFVSSFAYGSICPALAKLENPPYLVFLSDITEMSAPKTARGLRLPAHSLSIANVLNGIEEDFGGTSITGASFIAPEAKVLIVDDVIANLKVAEGLMLPYEMQITLCSSGREAVELTAKNHYDLVFMDHMMPEMDGLEAAARIREKEGEYFKSLPIIALTANAVSGVKEMFVQNGMNDFLAKPIETAMLDAILEKWIPNEKRKLKTSPDSTEFKSNSVEQLYNHPALSVSKAVSILGGSEKVYERIIKLSVRLLPKNIERLNSLIKTDLRNYSIEVHGIKGVLNNMGAYGLGTKANELENLSKEGDWETCKVLHTEFSNRLIEFYDSLSGFTKQPDIVEKPESNIAVLRNTLVQLSEAADLFDHSAALKTLQSVKDRNFGADFDAILDELTNAFECFDFDKAEELLEKLQAEIEKSESK